MTQPSRRYCDYEGSTYRTDFWMDAPRAFEDAADRVALRQLIPPEPGRLLEVGAGYGRLVNEYQKATHIYLADYAASMLADLATPADGPPITRVQCDVYALPFASASLDTVVMARVLHHIEDPGAALAELHRVLRLGGSLVLEHANRRHLKAVVGHVLGRPAPSPFERGANEFVPLNWNFHPAYVEDLLTAAGLAIRERRGASHFRAEPLKRLIPAHLLAMADGFVGRVLARAALGPSVWVRAIRQTGPPATTFAWRCPDCGAEPLSDTAGVVACQGCGRQWRHEGDIWRFRTY